MIRKPQAVAESILNRLQNSLDLNFTSKDTEVWTEYVENVRFHAPESTLPWMKLYNVCIDLIHRGRDDAERAVRRQIMNEEFKGTIQCCDCGAPMIVSGLSFPYDSC